MVSNALSGEATVLKLFCLPSKKGSALKQKEFAPTRSKFFLFRVDLFPEGDFCVGKQTGSTKVVLLIKMVENLPSLSNAINS